MFGIRILTVFCLIAIGPSLRAELPTGYFVWSQGESLRPETRKIYRMTLPEKTDVRVLTSGTPGADIEGQISPDGKWVAFAKAKLPDSTYHMTKMWKIYVVSIHGIGDGREENKIDDNGYWPSWGADGELYYSQVDDDGSGSEHTRIMRVTLDDYGFVQEKVEIFSTREHFPNFIDMNECYMAPGADWFAARIRGEESESGVGAISLHPPEFHLLAKAGSVGCMPIVAPSGTWGLIAGRDKGIRWGDAPGIPDRLEDEMLIPPRSDGDLCYHPGISTDEQWVLAAHSTESNHDSGPYDVYIYKLTGKTVDEGQVLAEGGFNGWPHVWVGEPSDPPPPKPHVDSFMPDSWTLTAGDTVELSWQTSFADEITLDGQSVDPDGNATFSPSATTSFRLVASSTEVTETDEASVEITVNDSDLPVVIESFELVPDSIELGESALLSWSVQNPHTLNVNGNPVTPEGSMEVSPVTTTDYVLTATGHQGPVTATVTLTVEELKQGLEDRGGCFCGSMAPGGTTLFGLGLIWLFMKRRRQSS
ncbi:MAG: hypothetical protein JRF33_26285 [Deltaproteobacteria bacterium]|nr:hypothetical protein [Deltaproteobacteria bacterium]